MKSKKALDHTQEPWELRKVLGGKSWSVVRKFDHAVIALKVSHADGLRIVQCVNACAGVLNPEVVPHLMRTAESIENSMALKGYLTDGHARDVRQILAKARSLGWPETRST